MNIHVYLYIDNERDKRAKTRTFRIQEVKTPLHICRPPKFLGSVSFNWSSRNRNCDLTDSTEFDGLTVFVTISAGKRLPDCFDEFPGKGHCSTNHGVWEEGQ